MAAYPGDAGFVPKAPGPAGHAWPTDESDTEFFVPTTSIYVVTTGDVVVQLAGVKAGNPVTYAAVPAGTTLFISAIQFLTASTATIIRQW